MGMLAYPPTRITGRNFFLPAGSYIFLGNITPSYMLSKEFRPVVHSSLKLIRNGDQSGEPFGCDQAPALVQPLFDMLPVRATGIQANSDPA